MGDKTTNTSTNNTSNTTANTTGATSGATSANSLTGASTDQTNNQLTSNTGATTGATQSTLPSWAQALIQGNAQGVSNLQSTDPSSLIAGPSALQNQAFSTAGNLSTDPSGDYGLAQSLTGLALGTKAPTVNAGQATSTDASGLINSFLNPNTSNVVDSTLADYDQNAAQQQAAYAAQGAANGAFGGSGYALGATNLDASLARARATTDSTLRSNAYQQAVTAAQQQAAQNTGVSEANANNTTTANAATANLANDSINRLLTGASTLQGLGTAQDASQLANLNEQSSLGATQQALNQAQTSAPLTLQSALGSLLGSSQLGLLGGQTSTGTSASNGTSLGQQIVNALTATDTSGQTSGQTSGTTTGTTNSTGNSTQTTSDPTGGLGTLLGGLGTLTSGLQDAGGLSGLSSLLKLSDNRLKRDVRTIGRYANGVRKVSFRYLWSDRKHVGAIAQEVAKVLPHAVSRHPSGYMQVDYAMMGG